MRSLLKAHQATLFYVGTLISSVGTMTFGVALIAFMLRDGYSLFEASLIIGLQRLIPVLFSFFFGDWTDRLAPRTVILATETSAALGTLGILWSWSLGRDAYWALLIFTLIKSMGLAFQGGSRALITKLLSQDHYASHSKNAIWLNNATQGATLFGGVLGLVAVNYFSMASVIWFDFSTFVINGLAVLLLSVGVTAADRSRPARESLLLKFRDFYRYNPRAAMLDGLLALAMMGNMSFRARVAGPHERWIPAFMISYGVAVWLAGFIERRGFLRNYSSSLWLFLGIAYGSLGILPAASPFALALFLLRDTSYWLLLHRLSSYIQADTPKSVFGSVTAARNAIMVAIIGGGEVLVGLWQNVVPLPMEGLWRLALCLGVAGSVFIMQTKVELGYERPRI